MIDIFSIALTHGLIVLAAWFLLARDDLDEEPPCNLDDDSDGSASGNDGNGPARGGHARPSKHAQPWLANQKYLNRGDNNA